MLAHLVRLLLPLLALAAMILPAQAVTPKVVSGSYHSLLLKPDGTVWAWGVNDYGQVGDGTRTDRASAQHIAGLAGIRELAANWRHSLALKRDGTVWAWGANYLGQLGDGTETDRYLPIKVSGLSGVAAIAAGAGHSVAAKSDGTVSTWGLNTYGQLGDGTATQHPSPVAVPNLSGVVAVAAGNSHTLALKSDGTVWAWGWNEYGQLGDGTTVSRSSPVAIAGLANVRALAAGPTYSLAVMNDGTVRAWGFNYGTSPTAVAGLTGIVAVAAGGHHNLAMRADGSMAAWDPTGSGSWGHAVAYNLYDAVAIAAGDGHSVVIRRDGTVWGSGVNTSGQLGDGTKVNRPNVVPVAFGSMGYTALANGGPNSVAISADGKVWAWGSNGSSIAPRASIPNLGAVDQVAAGEAFSLARKTDGTVMAWGANQFCQLGKGDDTSYSLGAVSGLTNVVALAGGYAHSLAVKADGTVFAWGINGNGQLGDGTTTQQCAPIQVVGLTATSVAAGWNHSIALDAYGTVRTWGAGNYGQMGDGSTAGRLTPLAVPGVGAKAVAAGGYHNLALDWNGTVWAWGTNSNGELGDGTTTQRNSPVQVVGLSNVVAVAAGYRHSLALKSDGTVWAWGGNSSGQIGIGNTTNQLTPVQVVGLTDIRAVASGSASTKSMALRSDGTILVWGDNAQSTLGDGTYGNRLTPVPLDDFFPAGDAVPANWLPTAGSLSAWTAAAETSYAGTQALKSGSLGNLARSGIRYSGNFRDGFVSFQFKVSSEQNADYLRFYIDGELKEQWSGEQGWTRAGIFVPAGVHEVIWEYAKNDNGTSGSDAAWIDSVELPTAFADVASSSWAFDYVNALKDAGITTGCGGSNYCPGQYVTREQMAAFIIRAVEGEPAACATPPFGDVPTTNSFCKYIKRMLDLNITTGCGAGNYCPSQTVDRQQMAAFIIRAVEGNPLAGYCGSTSPFSDVPTSSGFCGHIKRMLELNITTGCGGGNYCPTQAVTRDQMAAFLSRAFLGM